MSKGERFNKGKIRADLVPAEMVESLAAIFTYGATEKPRPDGGKGYGDNNWMKGLSFRDVYASALRHILAYRRGEYIDQGKDGSGYPHLWHAFWNIGALIYYNHPNHYDRYEKYNDFLEEWAQLGTVGPCSAPDNDVMVVECVSCLDLGMRSGCPNCGATAVESVDKVVKCKECYGTGTLSMAAHSGTCPYCDGKDNNE